MTINLSDKVKIENTFLDILRKKSIRISNMDLYFSWIKEKIFFCKMQGYKEVKIKTMENYWVLEYIRKGQV